VQALVMEVAVERLTAMLDRARRRGEKPPDLTDLMDHLLTPPYVRALLGRPLTRAVADRLVERWIG
jgi:hypothetical protein